MSVYMCSVHILICISQQIYSLLYFWTFWLFRILAVVLSPAVNTGIRDMTQLQWTLHSIYLKSHRLQFHPFPSHSRDDPSPTLGQSSCATLLCSWLFTLLLALALFWITFSSWTWLTYLVSWIVFAVFILLFRKSWSPASFTQNHLIIMEYISFLGVPTIPIPRPGVLLALQKPALHCSVEGH